MTSKLSPFMLSVISKVNSQLRYPSAILGSVALTLYGIRDLNPIDLDIVIDQRDFERLFPDSTQQSRSASGRLKSYLATVNVDGIDVDYMAAVFETNMDGSALKQLKFVKESTIFNHQGTLIQVSSLENQKRFYQLLDRPKDRIKIDLINKLTAHILKENGFE